MKDVVMDKISGHFSAVDENIPSSPPRYKCSHCPISFAIQSNLTEHLLRKHKVVQSASNKMDTVRAKSVFINANIKTELSTKQQTRPILAQSNSNISLNAVVGVRKKWISRTNGLVLAPPNQHLADGKICRICSKEFPNSTSMKRHFEDIHNPGEYPCRGCYKMFTSKNKLSSHYSRNCKMKTL